MISFETKILNQFDELINLGQEVLATQRSPGTNVIGDDRVDAEAAQHWATRTQGLLSRVYGESSPYYKNFVQLTAKFITFSPATQAFGVLRAARKDYEAELVNEFDGELDTKMKRNPRKIFVVHGRNDELRRSLFVFLRSIGLDPIEWSEAVKLTGKSAPYIGEILEAAFDEAQAVVVLLTPDDEAALREEFWHPDDPSYERILTGQARPNVIFEAGMAFARHAERTILIEVGELRPFSDVAGRYALRLNNSAEKRKELVERLKAAGCDPTIEGKSDWLNDGDFSLQVTKKVARRRNEAKFSKLLANPSKQALDFDEMTHRILKMIFKVAKNVSVDEISRSIGIEQSVVDYHFDLLQTAGFLNLTQIGVESDLRSSPPMFGITTQGKKYVVKNKI